MIFETFIAAYMELIAGILKKLNVYFTKTGFKIFFDADTEASIDERIMKIDQARANLVDGLKAIDELRESAKVNKKEVQTALEQLAQLEEDKRELEEQLKTVRQIIKTDVTTFKEIAGIPSSANIRRQRFIGFISGVIASVVASGIIFGVTKAIAYFTRTTSG